VAITEIRFSLSRVCSSLLWATVVCLFSDFSTVFSQRLYSLARVGAEVSFPLSQQLASDLTEISFSALCQKKKEEWKNEQKRKNNSPGLCRLPLC